MTTEHVEIGRICYTKADGTVINYDLKRDTVIGRGADCDIRIKQNTVSRTHCRVYRKWALDGSFTGPYLLENVSTTNLTEINYTAQWGVVQLIDGDVITIGERDFVFRHAVVELTAEQQKELMKPPPGTDFAPDGTDKPQSHPLSPARMAQNSNTPSAQPPQGGWCLTPADDYKPRRRPPAREAVESTQAQAPDSSVWSCLPNLVPLGGSTATTTAAATAAAATTTTSGRPYSEGTGAAGRARSVSSNSNGSSSNSSSNLNGAFNAANTYTSTNTYTNTTSTSTSTNAISSSSSSSNINRSSSGELKSILTPSDSLPRSHAYTNSTNANANANTYTDTSARKKRAEFAPDVVQREREQRRRAKTEAAARIASEEAALAAAASGSASSGSPQADADAKQKNSDAPWLGGWFFTL